MRNNKNVGRYLFGRGSFSRLEELLAERESCGSTVFLVDCYFQKSISYLSLPNKSRDIVKYISTDEEPSTEGVDEIVLQLKLELQSQSVGAVVGIGGGIVLDTAKAVSNMLTNDGSAAAYQGWDLVTKPGVYKIGIPTLSGTGAEASRTCVLTNKNRGIKLGMNSDYSIFDQVILDPDLTKTVPRDQYFYTGMDAYIHCIESLSGSFRNSLADSYSRECVTICREVFMSKEMMSDGNREKIMVGSYLGGAAIASSFVGVVHPLSAALSVVFGTHHCLANCIVMNVMDDFYPDAASEFRQMAKLQNVKIPRGIAAEASDSVLQRLYSSCIIHEKPLANALGQNYRSILTENRVKEIFLSM